MWPFKKQQKIDTSLLEVDTNLLKRGHNLTIREQITSNPMYQQMLENRKYHENNLKQLKQKMLARKPTPEAVRFIKDWEARTKTPTPQELMDELFPVE